MPDIGTELHQIESRDDLTEEEKKRERDKVIRDFSVKSRRLHAVHQLLKAYTLFERDVDYVIMDGQVKIVDEQTGRIMEGRRLVPLALFLFFRQIIARLDLMQLGTDIGHDGYCRDRSTGILGNLQARCRRHTNQQARHPRRQKRLSLQDGSGEV